MKSWIWWLAVILAVALLGMLPFSGTDVAKLQPVQLIMVSAVPEGIVVRTDTGDSGNGQSLAAAFADLKQTASGDIFLETAENLLITREAAGLLPELTSWLRPGCSICTADDMEDLEAAASYLSAHKPDVTLRHYRAGEQELPELKLYEGRLCLVQP